MLSLIIKHDVAVCQRFRVDYRRFFSLVVHFFIPKIQNPVQKVKENVFSFKPGIGSGGFFESFDKPHIYGILVLFNGKIAILNLFKTQENPKNLPLLSKSLTNTFLKIHFKSICGKFLHFRQFFAYPKLLKRWKIQPFWSKKVIGCCSKFLSETTLIV